MDVAQVARHVGVQDPAVIGKAREYMRLASVRLSGGLGQGEVCKASVCLELACSSMGAKERPPRDKFIRFGCATAKVYQTSYLMLQRALQVAPASDLQDIALYLEATHLIEPVKQLLRVYEQRFLESLATGAAKSQADIAAQARAPSHSGQLQQQPPPPPPPPQQQQLQRINVDHAAVSSADFNRPVFAAAAFALLGKARKVKVDGAKLRQRLALTAADYNTTLASMAALCSDVINGGSSRQAGKRKRKLEQEDPADEEGEEAGRGSGSTQGRKREGVTSRRGRQRTRGAGSREEAPQQEPPVGSEQLQGLGHCSADEGSSQQGDEHEWCTGCGNELEPVEEDTVGQDEGGVRALGGHGGRGQKARHRRRGRK